ncbi:hypothetical protein Cgig2_006080 [Carnegiea gigantea]|uniref:Uncharacterized protein n=1 Tax=Carnegiea gigantea TaxID=171969 RepID=A0A9Q1L079_9CARY|nr:hypothetical protein Cgig2_006080 [Carnegiea gigantea]
MPGNEVDGRVHNFFEQGNLSQDQRHTQLVEGSWPVFNNNSCLGSERQVGGHLTSSYKGESDGDGEKGNQFSLGPYGLNSTQSSLRPELMKNSSHPRQVNLNGFMHTSQVAHTRQNEANLLGLAEPDRHNLTSRGLPILESQQRGGLSHTHPVSFGSSEPPMNFNFFGGQQQMSGQQPGMLQSMPQQPLAINDAQLMPQQLMLKQMQELQKQRQFQQLDAMQRNVASQIPTFANQVVGQHSLAINGNPMYDASNYPWPSQVMAGNVNWPQQGLSSPMQEYSNGLMITPEGQALRFMGLTQQPSHSLYGVPVSSSHNVNTFSFNQFDKPGAPQVSAPNNSFSGNSQYAPLPEQVRVQGGTTASRPGSEGISSLDYASSQGLAKMASFGSFNQMQQKRVPISESGKQDSADGSELLREKSVTVAAAKQAAVALDPTEEKILFGSDESIWEAFGGTSVMSTGGANRLDGSDLSNAPPLLHSGTWSALMQSAVAETSSTDVAMQEEWSGLDCQNIKSQPGNQRSSVCQDNVQGQPVWVDRSQQVGLDSQDASNNVNSNYINSSGVQQPFPNCPSQSLPIESQISQERSKLMDGNQLLQRTGKNWPFENAHPSRDFPKTDSGFWSNQQGKFLHENNDQSSGKPSALNFIESGPANGSMTSANQHELHVKDHNRHVSMDTSHSAAMRSESISNYTVNMGYARDDAVAPNFRNLVNHESKPKFHDNRHLDFWNSVNSSVQFGIKGSGKDQHNLSEGPPVLESSVSALDGGAAEMHETDNGDAGEKSNDGHRLGLQHQGPAGALRETVWSDAGNRRSLHGGNERPPEQAVKPVPVTRKFQYHPMGDLDMDVDSCSYPSKQSLQSQPIPQHLSSGVRAHETQGLVFFHGGTKISDGVSSSGIHSGQDPSTSTSFVKSGEISSWHQNLPPSQNMLELLHKVDQSEEQTSVLHLGSVDGNGLSETASAVKFNQNQSSTSHGFNLQLAPPSQTIAPSNANITSQSSSRTVGSPSSGSAALEKVDKGHGWLTSVSSTQYSRSSHPPPQMASLNDKYGVSGSMDADCSSQNMKGNLSAPLASGSYLRNPLRHHHMVDAGGKTVSDQTSVPFDKHAYLDHPISGSQDQVTARQSVSNSLNSLASGRGMNRFGLRTSMHQMPMSSPGPIHGMFRNGNLSPSGATMWSQHHLLGVQPCDAAEMLKSQFQSNDVPGAISFSQQQADEQDHLRRADAVRSQGIAGGEEPMITEAQPTGRTACASQEEAVVKHRTGASPSNSAASQKDFEHQSIKPSRAAEQSYSLLKETQAMKCMVADPSHHESKRLKGSENISDTQAMSGNADSLGGQNNVVGDPSMRQISTSGGDAKILNLSPQPGNGIASFQLAHGSFTSRETLPFGPNDPQKLAAGNVASGVEHSGISSQTSPSWFQQYGAFKNGQSLSMHSIPRLPMANNADQQLIGGKYPHNLDGRDSMQLAYATTDPGQIPKACQTTNTNVRSELVSSLDALVPYVSNPALASITPKKRKTAASDLLSFSKEVGQGFMRLQNMSSAEVDWAKSSNCLVEKVEDEADANEDIVRINRPKRRLVLTTQLMQQVLRSPSPAVLSLIASSNYEIIVYSLARLTLGDACSLVCCSESDSPVHLDSGSLVCSKVKTSEQTHDQYFVKVIEDLISRAKELENELLRLDKRASILDFRLDLQDLERFSVINRFARFHGRSQVDGAEPSSSSSDPAAVILRPCPQRYVSAHPMPRNIPDRVQCLSL